MVKLTETVVYNRTKSAIENVKRLNLWGCDVDDISICERMVNLEVLSLSVNQIRNLEPLAKCDNLQELYLRKNGIESLKELEPLKHLPKLTVLWLDENPCASLPNYRRKVLRLLPKLHSLDNTLVTEEEVREAHLPPTPPLSHSIVGDGRPLSVDSAEELMRHQQSLLSSSLNETVHFDQPYYYTPMAVTARTDSSHSAPDDYPPPSMYETEIERELTPVAELVYYNTDQPMMTSSMYAPSQQHQQSPGMSSSMYVDVVGVPPLECVAEEEGSAVATAVHDSPRSVAGRGVPIERSISSRPLMNSSSMDMSTTWPEFSIDDMAVEQSVMSQSYHPSGGFVYQPVYQRAQSVLYDSNGGIRRQSRSAGPGVTYLQQRTPRQPRSSTLPRSTAARRKGSNSPTKTRMANILVAVNSLLDELDQNGLRTVIDEAQKRIKKQR